MNCVQFQQLLFNLCWWIVYSLNSAEDCACMSHVLRIRFSGKYPRGCSSAWHPPSPPPILALLHNQIHTPRGFPNWQQGWINVVHQQLYPPHLCPEHLLYSLSHFTTSPFRLSHLTLESSLPPQIHSLFLAPFLQQESLLGCSSKERMVRAW